MRCPNCGYDGYQGGDESCYQCGQSALIGPVLDDDDMTSESVPARYSESGDETIVCPACEYRPPVFDGWNCTQCGYSLSDKGRKAHPRVLSSEEDAALRRRLGIK